MKLHQFSTLVRFYEDTCEISRLACINGTDYVFNAIHTSRISSQVFVSNAHSPVCRLASCTKKDALMHDTAVYEISRCEASTNYRVSS